MKVSDLDPTKQYLVSDRNSWDTAFWRRRTRVELKSPLTILRPHDIYNNGERDIRYYGATNAVLGRELDEDTGEVLSKWRPIYPRTIRDEWKSAVATLNAREAEVNERKQREVAALVVVAERAAVVQRRLNDLVGFHIKDHRFDSAGAVTLRLEEIETLVEWMQREVNWQDIRKSQAEERAHGMELGGVHD